MIQVSIRKKIIFAAAGFCLLFLAACTTTYKNSPYVGTWVSTTTKSGDTTFSTADLIGEYRMEIREEGIVEVYNGTETETDSWKPTDQGIMLRLINGTEYAMFSEDGRLILEMQDVKFTFEKQQ